MVFFLVFVYKKKKSCMKFGSQKAMHEGNWKHACTCSFFWPKQGFSKTFFKKLKWGTYFLGQFLVSVGDGVRWRGLLSGTESGEEGLEKIVL